jgi:hypothetical protein
VGLRSAPDRFGCSGASSRFGENVRADQGEA